MQLFRRNKPFVSIPCKTISKENMAKHLRNGKSQNNTSKTLMREKKFNSNRKACKVSPMRVLNVRQEFCSLTQSKLATTFILHHGYILSQSCSLENFYFENQSEDCRQISVNTWLDARKVDTGQYNLEVAP